MVIVFAVCTTIIFFASTKLNLLYTKEQRNRIRKISMLLNIVILAVSFLGAVSYKGPVDELGKNKINLKTATREDWTQGENKQYVEQALKIYDIMAYYPHSDMVGREDFLEALSMSASNFIKEYTKSHNKVTSDDFFNPNIERLQLFFDLSQQNEYKKLYEKTDYGTFCWTDAINDEDPERFTYQVKGNVVLCYCKQHKTLENILPYHLYEMKIVKELEKNGLPGLGGWLKKQEDSGITVETKDHQKIIINAQMDAYDEENINGVTVGYNDMGLMLQFNSCLGTRYRYIDDMKKSVDKIGWSTDDIMEDGYEKGILCHATNTSIKKLKEEECNLTPIAELVMDKNNVKQLCFNITRYDAKKGSKLIVNNEQEIYQMLKLIGMKDDKALELIKELKCVTKTETGNKDGFAWSLSLGETLSYVNENVDCNTYVLKLSKE